MMMLTRERTEKSLSAVTGFSSASLGKSPLLHRLESGDADIIAGILRRYDSTPDAVYNAVNGTYSDEAKTAAIKKVFPEAELISPKKWAGETLGSGYAMNKAFAAATISSGKYGKVLVTGVDMIGNYCSVMIERV